MDATPFVVVALLAIGGGFAVWRWLRPRRDRPSDAPLTAEATARFEAVLKSDPSATMVERLDLGDDVPEVSAHELQFRLFAWALNREQATEINTAAHEAIAAATAATVNDVSKDARYLPRRPQLLPQLMQVVNDDAASLRAIARLIARDPALTGNLLRIANSPAYRMQPAPIESIERAVAVLGTHGIRSTIAAALMQPVLSTTGTFMPLPEVIWDHSLRTAAAAESHAMLVGNDDPFAAQLLGLLYGLAAIAIFRVVRDEFADHPEAAPSATLMTRLIDEHAAPVAARIASQWELSDRIVAALGEQQPVALGETRSPLGQALYFGRVAATLAMLVDAARTTPEEGREQLPGGRRYAPQVDKIWERLMRAARAVRDASMLIRT
jgi:HD-like signal output (HDOD) protein